MPLTYAVRRNALEKPTVWAVGEDDVLTAKREGRPDRRFPLSELRHVKVVASPAGYGRRQRALILAFAGGRASIGSHNYVGLSQLQDQTTAFSAFARILCERAARASPAARFASGADDPSGVVVWTAGLLALAIAALLVASATAGALPLGLDLSARLAFVLSLLLALRPWMRNNRGRGFDPRAFPAEVLP